MKRIMKLGQNRQCLLIVTDRFSQTTLLAQGVAEILQAPGCAPLVMLREANLQGALVISLCSLPLLAHAGNLTQRGKATSPLWVAIIQ